MKELKNFRLDERIQVHNLGSLCSDRSRGAGLITLKKCFLPNEPKAVQCLPRFLKNKVLTNRIRTDQNRIKTPLNHVKTPSKPLNSTPK
jgi:hypothetical protein